MSKTKDKLIQQVETALAAMESCGWAKQLPDGTWEATPSCPRSPDVLKRLVFTSIKGAMQ